MANTMKIVTLLCCMVAASTAAAVVNPKHFGFSSLLSVSANADNTGTATTGDKAADLSITFKLTGMLANNTGNYSAVADAINKYQEEAKAAFNATKDAVGNNAQKLSAFLTAFAEQLKAQKMAEAQAVIEAVNAVNADLQASKDQVSKLVEALKQNFTNAAEIFADRIANASETLQAAIKEKQREAGTALNATLNTVAESLQNKSAEVQSALANAIVDLQNKTVTAETLLSQVASKLSGRIQTAFQNAASFFGKLSAAFGSALGAFFTGTGSVFSAIGSSLSGGAGSGAGAGAGAGAGTGAGVGTAGAGAGAGGFGFAIGR